MTPCRPVPVLAPPARPSLLLLLLPLVAVLACATGAPTPAPSKAAPCALTDADRVWLEGSIATWRAVRDDLLGLPGPDRTSAVFFDAACTLVTDRIADPVTSWRARSHGEMVTLPNDDEMPAVVTSFAAPIDAEGDGDEVFFVMSTPDLWRAGGVDSALGLETLMRAVLLHEMSHTVQFGSYGRRVTELTRDAAFGQEVNDDLSQDLFGDDPEYVAAMEREIELWFEAAGAADDATARSLARRAWDALTERRERFGGDAPPGLWGLENEFLSLEGSGQWVAVSWLVHAPPLGAGVDRATALREFGRRGGRWTQDEGLGMALTLDRLDPAWRDTLFGDGSRTLPALLEAALTNGSP